MGPIRNTRTEHQVESHHSNRAGPSRPRPRRVQPEAGGVPGVQKIKSAVRGAQRLLMKDNLAADVRVQTERRLKALEADLVQARVSRIERTFAVRYHKAKFFERQKVVRRLNQTKRRLAAADASEKPLLESALYDLRVDLNYILHFPTTKRYISLFPPEVRQGKVPPRSEDTAKTDAEREEVRSWIRRCMENGELLSEPEVQLESSGGRDKQTVKSRNWKGNNRDPKSTLVPALHDADIPDDAEQDDFFAIDDENNDDE